MKVLHVGFLFGIFCEVIYVHGETLSLKRQVALQDNVMTIKLQKAIRAHSKAIEQQALETVKYQLSQNDNLWRLENKLSQCQAAVVDLNTRMNNTEINKP